MARASAAELYHTGWMEDFDAVFARVRSEIEPHIEKGCAYNGDESRLARRRLRNVNDAQSVIRFHRDGIVPRSAA